jgi:hypothetical protein
MNIKTVQKVAIVSTFSPTKCGIAAYADQIYDCLKIQNSIVTKISVSNQVNVDKSLNICGFGRFLKLIPIVLTHDKVVINYHRSFFLCKN